MVLRCGKKKSPIQKHHPVGQRTTLLDTLIFGSKLGNSVLDFNYVTDSDDDDARVLSEQERRGRLAIRLKARGLALAAPTHR